MAAVIIDAIGRSERIRTSDLSVPNHRFGKELSFCLFESCSHHEFVRVLRFFHIRCQRMTATCCELCPQIGHKKLRSSVPVTSHYPIADRRVSTSVNSEGECLN